MGSTWRKVVTTGLTLVVVGVSDPVDAQRGARETPAARQAARLEGLKREAAADVERMAKLTQEMVDSVFSFGELGFQEHETSRYLTGVLREHGFTVREGIADMPTAWVATWGSGQPVIALGSDIDGIPRSSQKPGVAYRAPIVDGAPGHGEGHNSGQAVNITAAIAIKRIMEREGLPGTLVIWPGVAEELVAGKAFLVREGIFADVDVCLFSHVSSTMNVSWGAASGTGLVSVEYRFRGQSAHSAGAPWRGRSALDAVELMNVGWNFRREHLRLQHRSHYVIRDGGDQPNVVPSTAAVWYYFREITYPGITALWEIGDTMARACSGRPGPGTSTGPWPRRCMPTSRPSGCPSGARPTRRSRRPCSAGSASPRTAWRPSFRASTVPCGKRTTGAAARTISATCPGSCPR